jgi:hypothetical protein
MVVTSAEWLARKRWPAGLAWALWTLVVIGLTTTPWLNQLARQAGRTDLGSDANTVVYGLVAVSAATVGAVLAGRRPRHPVGWLLLAFGLWFVYGYAGWVLLACQGAPAAVGLVVLDANVVVIPAVIGFILLLTPTGTLPSPGWRWWARVAAAAPVVGLVSLALGPFRGSDQSVANPLAVGALAGPLLVVRTVAFVVAGLAIPVGAWSLMARFRRAGEVERQQLRWLVVAVPVTLAVAALAAQALTGNEVDLDWLPGICLAVLPLGSERRSYGIGCMTWTASSAAPWSTACSRCCWAVAMPSSSSGSVSSSAGIPPWWWRPPPWPWRRCPSRPAAESKQWWIGVQPAPP